MERSPLLRVREFVMRNEGTEDHLKQCTAMLVSEIDAGRAGLVRLQTHPTASAQRWLADLAAAHRAPRSARAAAACSGGRARLRSSFRVCACCALLFLLLAAAAEHARPAPGAGD